MLWVSFGDEKAGKTGLAGACYYQGPVFIKFLQKKVCVGIYQVHTLFIWGIGCFLFTGAVIIDEAIVAAEV